MDWFGISGPLVAVRAIHFAASALTTGTLIFRAVVVKPALRSEPTAAKQNIFAGVILPSREDFLKGKLFRNDSILRMAFL